MQAVALKDVLSRPEILIRECCPACHSTQTQTLTRCAFDASPVRDYLEKHHSGRAEIFRLAGHEYAVDECSDCGLIFQRAVPTGDLLTDLYDRWISPKALPRHRERYSLSKHRYQSAQVDWMLQHFKRRPFELDVLDFGFGWADWALTAKSFGCNVSGCELSPDRIAYARSIDIEIVDWSDIPKRRFHFIHTEQVFEHLLEPRETLVHLAKALRPGGIIKLSVPDGRGIKSELSRLKRQWPGGKLMPIAPLEHLNCWTHASLKRFAESVGLREVRPKLSQLYNATSGWLSPKEALNNLLRPLYRHVYPKAPFIYFTPT